MPAVTEEIITASTARAYWHALVENVVSLIEDAALLLEQSPARARSLLILAQEETGKAQRLYVLAESAWTGGLPVVALPKRFLELEGRHSHKIAASLEYAEELLPFWGDYSGLEDLVDMTDDELRSHWQQAEGLRTSSAAVVNREKQAGFYVDRVGADVVTPQAQDVGDLVSAITRTAGVVEMLLISDHSRMKFHTPDRYESSGPLQRRLLPFSHPVEFFASDAAGAADPAPEDG